jgi:uncharacterized protein (DUF697 family)
MKRPLLKSDEKRNPPMARKPRPSPPHEEKSEVATTTSPTTGTPEVTPERHHEMAAHLVDRFALWSGAAGLIPVPVLDWVTVGGVQIQMVRRLSQIYEVEFSENRGKALIASLAGSMVPASSASGVASLAKSVPILGALVSVFVMPVLSAGATYAIGRTFMQHFESGGTLLDFNPPDYREFFKAQKEKWDMRTKGSASKPPSSGADTATGAPTTSP